jgi:hypothetical protein
MNWKFFINLVNFEFWLGEGFFPGERNSTKLAAQTTRNRRAKLWNFTEVQQKRRKSNKRKNEFKLEGKMKIKHSFSVALIYFVVFPSNFRHFSDHPAVIYPRHNHSIRKAFAVSISVGLLQYQKYILLDIVYAFMVMYCRTGENKQATAARERCTDVMAYGELRALVRCSCNILPFRLFD